MANLPLGVELLLARQRIESDRIEFKEGWNPDAIYRSICAFANDFDNIGGGYILIGVKETQGRAERPVLGLSDVQIAQIQREMIGFNHLIRPVYHPQVSIESVDGKTLLALWVYGGNDRPYEVPESVLAKQKSYKYFIRRYANTIEARGGDREELLNLASQVPFDDRPHRQASPGQIDLGTVQEFLRVSGSRLLEQVGSVPPAQILDQLGLLAGPVEQRHPRHVALMLFTQTPEEFLPYCYIDLVHFQGSPGDRTFTEKRFSGPMTAQIRQVLDYLRAVIVEEMVIKIQGQAEALRVWAYPFNALEEIIVNAVYHRNYQIPEPISIRIEPDRLMVYNCGGPDRSIRLQDLQEGRAVAGRYRNRRLGDFLKELGLAEGRSTGLALIRQALERNGSPPVQIESDEERSFFRITLGIHPEFHGRKPPEKPVRSADFLYRMKAWLTGNQAGNQVNDPADDLADDLADWARVLDFCVPGPRKQNEILDHLGKKPHADTRKRYIDPLEAAGLIEKTLPDKPTSPKQQYRLTPAGRNLTQGASPP